VDYDLFQQDGSKVHQTEEIRFNSFFRGNGVQLTFIRQKVSSALDKAPGFICMCPITEMSKLSWKPDYESRLKATIDPGRMLNYEFHKVQALGNSFSGLSNCFSDNSCCIVIISKPSSSSFPLLLISPSSKKVAVDILIWIAPNSSENEMEFHRTFFKHKCAEIDLPKTGEISSELVSDRAKLEEILARYN